jgi:Mg2+ and Co2+ transporter CorA
VGDNRGMIETNNEIRQKWSNYKPVVPETWQIPTEIRERFGETAGRQRAMLADGHLVLVLHQPPGPDDGDRVAKLLWRHPNGLWSCNIDGSLEYLLKKHIAQYAQLAQQLEDQLQSASSAKKYFQLLQSIAPLQRASRNLHLTLQQAREMIPHDQDIIAARDAASDVERAFELLYIDAKNALDFTVAEKAEIQSQRSYEMSLSAHRLNVLAALFFPITAITSIFGMNFASGLESLPFMFWTILAVGSLCGLCLVRTIAHHPAASKLD